MPEYAEADFTDKILLIPSNNERFQRRENVIIAPYWWLGWWLMTYGERQLLQDLKIDDDDLDDESDDERDARLRKRIRLMLEDLLLSKDLKDFMESMSNYLPRLKEYREDVRDFITELVTAIIYDKDYPAIPESLEDEPEYEQKCDVDLDE